MHHYIPILLILLKTLEKFHSKDNLKSLRAFVEFEQCSKWQFGFVCILVQEVGRIEVGRISAGLFA